MAREYDALVPYYGCKRQMADRVVEALGEHSAYWEPFCGSCAVFLSKPRARMEVLNDLNAHLVNLAWVVAGPEAPALFERLYRTAFSEALYEASVRFLREYQWAFGTPLEAAYHYFVASWQGRNGLVGTAKELSTGFCKRFTSNGGDPATRFRHAVERVPAWWDRLREATILREDGIALIGRIEDKPGTAIYCDPPYLTKGAEYLHDFAGGDHRALAEALARFEKTTVVVSYYDGEALDELYPRERWDKRPVNVQKNLAVVQKNLAVVGGKAKAPEVLLVNRGC